VSRRGPPRTPAWRPQIARRDCSIAVAERKSSGLRQQPLAASKAVSSKELQVSLG
jgi:hypothetical protein